MIDMGKDSYTELKELSHKREAWRTSAKPIKRLKIKSNSLNFYASITDILM